MFNLSKIIKNFMGISKVASRESALQEERDIQGLSSGDNVLGKALSIDHVDLDPDVIEKSLDNVRDGEADPSIVESAVDSHEGFTSRQPEKTDNYGDVSPIAVASEAWDARAREIYKKEMAKMGKADSILDKYIGDRYNIEMKVNNISNDDSGISNNPSRFSDYGSVPFEDAKKNMQNFDKEQKIKKISSQIMDLDAIRFAIELEANKRGHHTQEDQDSLSSVRIAKKKLLKDLRSV